METIHSSFSSDINNFLGCSISARSTRKSKNKQKKEEKLPFPVTLYNILEEFTNDGTPTVPAKDSSSSFKTHRKTRGTLKIVSWEDDGRGFRIHDPDAFNEYVLPKYSRRFDGRKTQFRSFQRQLNIYGFKMRTKTRIYYHELFYRGCDIESLKNIIRPCKKRNMMMKAAVVKPLMNSSTNIANNDKISAFTATSSPLLPLFNNEQVQQQGRRVSCGSSSNIMNDTRLDGIHEKHPSFLPFPFDSLINDTSNVKPQDRYGGTTNKEPLMVSAMSCETRRNNIPRTVSCNTDENKLYDSTYRNGKECIIVNETNPIVSVFAFDEDFADCQCNCNGCGRCFTDDDNDIHNFSWEI